MAWNHWVGIVVMVWLVCTTWQSAPAQSVPSPLTEPYSWQGKPPPAPTDVRDASPFSLMPSSTPASWRHEVAERGRHRGIGLPLYRTSWRNRPWFAGWQIGQLNGGDLVAGNVQQHAALMGGYWIGYDFDHYFGAEMEWAFAHPELSDSRWSIPRTGTDVFWDLDVLYYPWGDARYRPYFKLGLGVTGVHFEDERGDYFNRGLVTIPLGMGVKYYWKRWLALRLDLTDRIAIGSGRVATMHNWSFVGGVEWRFGGGRKVLYRP